MVVSRLLAATLVLATATSACSDDDDAVEPAPSTTPVTTPVPAAPVSAASATTLTVTASASTAASPSAPPTTVTPAVGLDELVAGLLTSDQIGLPASWTIRDLDPAVMDADTTPLADPLQGLATCPDGAVRPAFGWLQRTFSGAEPLDTGMLRVDLILAVEDTAGFAARRDALVACTTSGESFITTSAAAVGPATEGSVLVLVAGPTADVPYPSSYALVTANLDGRTVTAVVGGVDLGVPFEDTARELVGRALARS